MKVAERAGQESWRGLSREETLQRRRKVIFSSDPGTMRDRHWPSAGGSTKQALEVTKVM